jgi:hypothetical protein
MSRSSLLRRGAVLAVSSAGLGAFAGSAQAALPDVDLSYLRLLVGAELLKGDFEAKALRSGKLAGSSGPLVRRMAVSDTAHYAALAALMNGAGRPPATADDIDFAYPRGSFATQGSIVKLASKLTALSTGAYLGAVENVQTADVRLPLGQIAANEAQQAGALARLLGGNAIGSAFAPALTIDAVSTALDAYES